MGQDVDANGRSILHKGHGMTHTCAVPDVCKTPTPGGPVPIPYVNIAMDSDITDGAETVKIEGNPVANVGAKISTSTGDEAGSAGGGIISSKIKGTVTWKMGSLDVKAEGKMVVRFLDQDFHNGNSFNTSFKSPGRTGMAYGDDFEKPCPVCDKTADKHDPILETANSARICANIIRELNDTFRSLDDDDKGHVAWKDFDDNGRVKWNGYMVGVMICKHPNGSKPRIFAAMSGKGLKNGFKEIAAKHVDVVIGGGKQKLGDGGPARAATADDLIRANRSSAVKVAQEINDRWAEVAKKKGGGYNKPGICAAAHLIARSGHAPAQMTEMYFLPAGTWPTGHYSFRVDGVREERWFGPHIERTKETPWGNTVASCRSCQDLLYMALCPKRVCS